MNATMPSIDSSRLLSHYANVFEVSASPRDIVVVFGTIQSSETTAAGDPLNATLDTRIIMPPVLAKRFARSLGAKIRDYEAAFGALEDEVAVSGDNAQSQHDGNSCAPCYATQENAARADALVSLINGLGVEYGLERSFKISAGCLLVNRFIIGFKKSQVTDANDALMTLFAQMGMPRDFLEQCRPLLPDTEFVHFGFEEQREGCLYKAYLEFKIPQQLGPARPEPFLVFLGFKWRPDDPAQCAVSRYTCFPMLSLEEIQDKLAVLYERNPVYKSFETARHILQQAVKLVSNNKIIYEEVHEENNPRTSFDMNLYGANLRISDIYPLLMDIGAHYGLEPDRFVPLCDRISDKRFGHLSGGIDRNGNDFLTVYYGAETIEPPGHGRSPHAANQECRS
jgi:hypothetical protein